MNNDINDFTIKEDRSSEISAIVYLLFILIINVFAAAKENLIFEAIKKSEAWLSRALK